MLFLVFFHCKNKKQTLWIWLSVQRFIDLATQGTASGSDSSGDWLLFSWMFILVQDHAAHVPNGSTGLHQHSWKLDYIIPVSMKINQSCFPRTVDTVQYMHWDASLNCAFLNIEIPILLIGQFYNHIMNLSI